jgi:hypothetical protein
VIGRRRIKLSEIVGYHAVAYIQPMIFLSEVFKHSIKTLKICLTKNVAIWGDFWTILRGTSVYFLNSDYGTHRLSHFQLLVHRDYEMLLIYEKIREKPPKIKLKNCSYL